MASSAASLIEEHITCCVCLEIYTDPYALRCLHTYCYGCIQGIKQGAHVQCPDCRKFTPLAEMQKDFKIQSFIDLHRQSTGECPKKLAESESVGSTSNVSTSDRCTMCRLPDRNAMYYCSTCDKYLCVGCDAAHRNRDSGTGSHEVMALTEVSRLRQQIKITIKKSKSQVESKCNEGRDTIASIHETEVQQIEEVNQFRMNLKLQVDAHHDKVINQIETQNKVETDNLQQQVQHIEQSKSKLHNKINFLCDIVQSQDISIMAYTLRNLDTTVDQEIQTIFQELMKLNTKPRPLFTIEEGQLWDPERSTMLRMVATAPEPSVEENNSVVCGTGDPELAAWGYDEAPMEAQHRVTKQLHESYQQIDSINTTSWPRKICHYGEDMWVAGAEKGILKFDSNGQHMRQLRHPNLTYVTSLEVSYAGEIVVCDKEHGLLHFNQRGEYLDKIDSGVFSDASVCDNNMYALEFDKCQVCLYNKTETNTWVRCGMFTLQYTNGSIGDNVCSASNCVCVSSYQNHTIYVHSAYGELYFQTDGEGYGREGKLQYPHLCDMDTSGSLLVCDSANRMLKVYWVATNRWSTLLKLKEGRPVSAVVSGEHHIWVGTAYPYRLLKLKAIQKGDQCLAAKITSL